MVTGSMSAVACGCRRKVAAPQRTRSSNASTCSRGTSRVGSHHDQCQDRILRLSSRTSTPHVDGRAGVRPTVGARCDEIRLRQGSASDDAEHITQHGDPEDRPEEQHIVGDWSGGTDWVAGGAKVRIASSRARQNGWSARWCPRQGSVKYGAGATCGFDARGRLVRAKPDGGVGSTRDRARAVARVGRSV
jgi:hypothetical protein